MYKKFLLSFFLLSLTAINVFAQNNDVYNRKSGLALELGASVNYYYGQPGTNINTYDNNRLNWQLDGMLGFTIARDKSDRRTIIAAFGDFGFNNENTITNLLADQQYTSPAGKQASVNNFYRVEGGILIADMIRISTGIGQQNFNTQTLVSSSNGVLINASSLRYNSSTIGFKLNFGPVAWTINCNIAYGQDFNKTVITPESGLMLRF